MSPQPDDDPLTLAIQPPPDETPEQRQIREAAEAEAKRVSDEIDEQIKKEKELSSKKRKPVKLLLLGQSESGKTATLKNFQLTYARREWSEELSSWRAVIFLNLVRNANEILEHMVAEMADLPYPRYPENDSTEDLVLRPAKTLPPLKFKEKHKQLRIRLSPLQEVQRGLEEQLGAASTEIYASTPTSAAPFHDADSSGRRAPTEFSINSSNGWKSALDKFRKAPGSRPETSNGTAKFSKDSEEEIAEIIANCREDIKSLWEDSIVKEVLSRRKARIEDAPGFFLNDTDRIAAQTYMPTDDDVIRARLRTLGVQEYRFIFDHGRAVGQEWRLYDVGGTRSSRAAWYPYFDDVDAIIFLAPISPFDEKLSEDRRVNRLEDSYLLWKSVCSCKLLARTQIILFLNKCDLLQAKLQRGIRIRDSVPSFGDRKNDLSTATKYFQQHFKEIARQYSPVQRPFYVHLTSVIDTKSTAVTLGAVEESILREHLRRADLM
ncbi:hypothetical protein AGABI1DRAFT_102244 [Agaricus bisporus var. burnettii JB137-S8]|uniref:G-alpha-domain-containing protein n=2 Tax=Agaricus bisporus var. burnettii TaxID=192524 RepID=K5XPJ6_AGABU|nr:uncharacterized protein AGABI1DRAFT_102244 [Agaricus bisporus var. burnettii JB137-S8]EKM76630.1 hypothetical protein AGABI1DRAFT_102244 [Agaricus bisporus var. burnettii JB137-S8]KAF7759653.1 hypothetical protein Agabi119p4_11348 [Agaricus bisporus var. burnettii]